MRRACTARPGGVPFRAWYDAARRPADALDDALARRAGVLRTVLIDAAVCAGIAVAAVSVERLPVPVAWAALGAAGWIVLDDLARLFEGALLVRRRRRAADQLPVDDRGRVPAAIRIGSAAPIRPGALAAVRPRPPG